MSLAAVILVAVLGQSWVLQRLLLLLFASTCGKPVKYMNTNFVGAKNGLENCPAVVSDLGDASCGDGDSLLLPGLLCL
ncbi:hypothetical protein BFJ69_g4882 [Fusarium oxysporum]|uniref:Uncharacterized protein n=1 Tax=Fusarium oxysporum TaxID=5507 RepID=A0A420NGN2_FUSOX|nr:hypothetical protein BFJ69_g4882 [Fusarium oxysporum]